MKAIKGHYDGNVIVLEEPAPVDYESPVLVVFPEETPHDTAADASEHPEGLARFIGAARGLFATSEEADAFIRRERDAWDS